MVKKNGKEVAIKEEAHVPAVAVKAGAFASLDSRDIILPIITMRNNSYRNEALEDFKPGDIIKQPDGLLIASKDQAVQCVLLSISTCWRIMDVTGAEQRWLRNEPVAGRDVALEWQEAGATLRRDYTFICHILIVDELKRQAAMMVGLEAGEEVEPDDFVLPSRIQFSRTSSGAGKEFNTWAELCRAMNGQPISKRIFELSSESRSNDRGKWFAFKVVKLTDPKVRKLPEELQASALFWENTLKVKTFHAAVEDGTEDSIDTSLVAPAPTSVSIDEIPF